MEAFFLVEAVSCQLSALSNSDKQLAISDKPADRIAVRGKQLELEQAAEKMAIARFQAGKLSDADVAAARYLRLDAAVQLLRAKQKANAAPGK